MHKSRARADGEHRQSRGEDLFDEVDELGVPEPGSGGEVAEVGEGKPFAVRESCEVLEDDPFAACDVRQNFGWRGD